MQFRQYISSVVVALCVAEGVLGKDGYRQRRVESDVKDFDDTASPVVPTVANADTKPFSVQEDDVEHQFATHSSDEHETESLSSSESTLYIDEMDPTPIKAGLFVRQEEAEAIPTPDPNALPIEPRITPALGIAGAIMLGTGVALSLIGIKKQWLHVFLSTAYLASLAVTVLIIYVMNPEHSDAIQGAYVVAAVVTGLIFGSVSLVFQEVTDGLGCMLGSFCFAMWLLVLAPGGIIHSTPGRGVLIGVITVVGFALSFSHYTRMYGIICCTSFAGSTIIMLGVDCFSRAGLKEFWLYLWDLNDKQFPLDTTTYPITRGIRVEIACIIVVFLFGLVSQFKLWTVVKARRTKHEEARQQAEQERAEAEAAVGRDIEANTERERAQWEAVYGEKRGSRTHTDSGVGSSVETFGKEQYSVREREVDPIELSDIAEVQSPPLSGSEDKAVTQDEKATGETVDGATVEDSKSGRTSHDSSRYSNDDNAETLADADKLEDSNKAYAPGAPEVVPLPFRVPTEDDEQQRDQDQQSEAPKTEQARPESEVVPIPLRMHSLMKLNEEYAARANHRQDDQASSIAATADDIAMLGDDLPGAMSKRQSMISQGPDNVNATTTARSEHGHSRQPSAASDPDLEDALDEDDDEALPREPVTIDANDVPIASAPTEQQSTSGKSIRRLSDATKAAGPEASSDGHPGSVSESMVHQLPPKLSKIALTYRTNEWAKHIADADHPEADDAELARPSSPGVQVDTQFPEEVAKPVDVEALQQTNAPPVEQQEPPRKSSKASRKSQRSSRHSEPANNLNRASSTQSATPPYAFNHSSSQVSLNRQDSASSTPARPKIGSMRKSSMPLSTQPLVESPVEDSTETFQQNDFQPLTNVYAEPSGNASANNLLDERNKMLQRRPTTISFNGFRSTPTLGLMSGAIPEDQAHSPEQPTHGFTTPTQHSPPLPASGADDENMTLSQRRSLMHSQSATTTPTHKPRASIMSTLTYDSHQPARQPSTNTAQQSARLNQWRQTLQADAQAKQPPRAVESHARQSMLDDRKQSEMRLARRKEETERRQSAIDDAMRRGHLDGAHRDALRRMQAKANRD